MMTVDGRRATQRSAYASFEALRRSRASHACTRWYESSVPTCPEWITTAGVDVFYVRLD